MHNEVRKERAKFHEAVFGSYTKILTISNLWQLDSIANHPQEFHGEMVVHT
jgi:hypothetical protein